MPTLKMPTPQAVAARAPRVLTALQQWAHFERLEQSTKQHPQRWATFAFTTIAQWNLKADGASLWSEALRVMALKTAVWELTDRDEEAAELMVPAPVEAMIHATLAQANLVRRFERETGLHLVHMTGHQRFGWRPGDYTHRCYVAAWGTQPPERYWIAAEETARRHAILNAKFASIGIEGMGSSHTITFDEEPVAA